MKILILIVCACILAGCCAPSTMTTNPRQRSASGVIFGTAFQRPVCVPEGHTVVCPEGWAICDGEQPEPMMTFLAPASAQVSITPKVAAPVEADTSEAPDGAQIISRTVTRYEGGLPVEVTDGDE